MTTTVPTPLMMPQHRVAAEINEHDKVKSVRPGLIRVEHDGILKAKQVKPGLEIQSYLHDKPCGSIKTVETVTRSEDGATVTLTFSSAHPTLTYKAAYRFYVPGLAGTVSTRPGFVSHGEV